jgi:hypothetical protein
MLHYQTVFCLNFDSFDSDDDHDIKYLKFYDNNLPFFIKSFTSDESEFRKF